MLAKHDDVDGLWVFADAETCCQGQKPESIGNLKRVWTARVAARLASDEAAGDAFLRRAVEVKNVWVLYGD